VTKVARIKWQAVCGQMYLSCVCVLHIGCRNRMNDNRKEFRIKMIGKVIVRSQTPKSGGILGFNTAVRDILCLRYCL
jgi:hypothetical protein